MQPSSAHGPPSNCPRWEEVSAKSKTQVALANSRSSSRKAAFSNPTRRNSCHIIHSSGVSPCEEPGWAREKPRLIFAQSKAGQSQDKGDSTDCAMGDLHPAVQGLPRTTAAENPWIFWTPDPGILVHRLFASSGTRICWDAGWIHSRTDPGWVPHPTIGCQESSSIINTSGTPPAGHDVPLWPDPGGYSLSAVALGWGSGKSLFSHISSPRNSPSAASQGGGRCGMEKLLLQRGAIKQSRKLPAPSATPSGQAAFGFFLWKCEVQAKIQRDLLPQRSVLVLVLSPFQWEIFGNKGSHQNHVAHLNMNDQILEGILRRNTEKVHKKDIS